MAKQNQKQTAQAPAVSKRGRKKLDPNQSAADRFKEAGTARMNQALAIAESIGRLGTENYESTPEQRKRMQDAIQEAYARAFQRLADKPKTVKKVLFRF